MTRFTGSTALIILAMVGLFFPSSFGGVISFDLARMAMVANCCLLGWLLSRTGAIDRTQTIIAAGIVLWLTLVTLGSPQAEFSPGALFIFLGLALLLAIRLDHSASPGSALLHGINLTVLVLGLGLSLNVAAANAFVKEYYSAFYPGLMVSMIDWYHKPVFTLATHSTAGFFYYLFFWLNFRSYRATGALHWLAWTVVMLALGINVRSTTSTVLMAVAAAQLAHDVISRIPLRVRQPSLIVAVPATLLAAVLMGAPAQVSALTELIRGTRTAGLLSRYSSRGMLGGNLRYLSESPFSPIGFTYGPEDLFYGDSGFVLVMVRGSLPLLVLVYLGFGRFLYLNLRHRADAHCLFLVTCAFEMGYVPLQLFRYTLFLPFMIAYLNGLEAAGPPLCGAIVGTDLPAGPIDATTPDAGPLEDCRS